MDFGFTNDDKEHQRMMGYRQAVIADGWTCKPRYEGEPIDSYSEHEKNGFTLIICTRSPVGKWKYQAEVSIWGPDGLAIEPPKVYSMDGILKNESKCCMCKTVGVPTSRVAFANRVCDKCLPEARKKLEYPGWCN